MRTQRKIFALFLTLIVVISTIPTMALADGEPEDAYAGYIYEDGAVYKQADGEKTQLTEAELADFSGVSLHGIEAFNGKIFPTMQAAYDAISAELGKTENGGLEQGYPTDEAFRALYTDPYDGEEHQGVSLTWTIFGTVELGSDLPTYYLSGGRAAAWYGSDAKTVRRIAMVGYDGNAQMNIQKNPTMPYQWWGDTTDGYTELVIQDLTLDGMGNNISVSGNYTDEFALTLDGCTVKGFLFHYFNGEGSLTVNNCTFDGAGQGKAYALQVMGHETKPLTVQFTNNKVSGYPRGINIHQNTAAVTISGNEIETDHPTRAAIQLSACGEVSMTGNTIVNPSGSAFWFYPGYSCGDTEITGNIIESAYLFQVGDEEDQTLNEEVKAGLTFTNNDISGVADPYKSPVKDNEGDAFAHNILEGLEEDSGNTFVSEVRLDRDELTLGEGKSARLTAAVLPEHAPDKSVTWSSNNTNVAAVDQSGVVTAVSEGTATITATTSDGGKTAACTVTVNPAPTPIDPDSKAAAYKVEHYKENLDGSYTLADTDFPLYYQLDEVVNAEAKIYVGYTLDGENENAVPSGTVALPAVGEDGQPVILTLKLYYKLNEYTVSFNSDGGSAVASQTVKYGGKAEKPENPTKLGYTFTGWELDGTAFDFGTAVADNVTLTAQWSKRAAGGGSSGGSATYTVSVDSGKNGAVSVSPKNAGKGGTVTITATPDKGYEVDKVTVTDKDGNTVKVADKGDGRYTFTMPAGKVTVEVAFAKIEEAHTFTDVPGGYWAEDAIAWAYEQGYMNGNTATTFNPGGTVSRQQLWMILARLSGRRPADFAGAREWAVQSGVSDGTNPGGAVSRQQMVAILYRYAAMMGYETSGAADLTAFPDHAGVAAYAADAMRWSVANGIVGGTAQGTLNPSGTATRAQFAAILMRFCGKAAE